MQTERLACGNVDSCEPGTAHLFPVPGEQVSVRAACVLREVGADWPRVTVSPGDLLTVEEPVPECHEVIASLAGTRVWLDVEEVAAP